MPTLPDTTTAFALGATEAQFKTFLSGQRAFLAGLLGTDGTAATARSMLGANGVTSINGNSGAITAAQIAAAATAGYGYTPADTSHSHSNYVQTDVGYGAVGSFAIARIKSLSSPVESGWTVAGSNLYIANVAGDAGSSNPVLLSGTWRLLSRRLENTSNTLAGLFQRIA